MTSARMNKNIEPAFDYLIDKLVEHNPHPSPRTIQRKKSLPWWRKFGNKEK
jgi:hypothetical protein